MTAKEREDARKAELISWYNRGVRDGRKELQRELRLLLNAPSADDVAYSEDND